MAIPQISEQNIKDAISYIDEHGIPTTNKSVKYEVVLENGRKYPPKYLIAVAAHYATGENIKVSGFNATEAKNYFHKMGYEIDYKQEKFELTITADSVTSTDDRFDLNDLGKGDDYKTLDAYFQNNDGKIIHRNYRKSERKNTNRTLPMLACQIFEKQIMQMSEYDRLNFPICQYSPSHDLIKGIFSSVEEFRKTKNTVGSVKYDVENGPRFVFFCWNVFSPIVFVRECLRRFGQVGDKFVLVYREKDENDNNQDNLVSSTQDEVEKTFQGYRNSYSEKLIQSKNIILRGAPGTGKTFLAKEIAADIVSDGFEDNYESLTDEQKQQVEFVQFHPNYDYSDFVEGLRPKTDEDGTMSFELQDGIFKAFVSKARKNFEDAQKSVELIEIEKSVNDAITDFISSVEFGISRFETVTGNGFYIDDVTDSHIYITIPNNNSVSKLTLNIREIQSLLESGIDFEKVSDITKFFGKQFASQSYSYDFVLYKTIKENFWKVKKSQVKTEKLKKFIFIIDEINRGEISKILGELFFSIDPGYRGKAGEVLTQYSNMHSDPDEKFYIPENVYIIGTMNDIDRSVDSFDFAMRRRFRFIEVRAEDTCSMLEELSEEVRDDALAKMTALNEAIIRVPDLNENYQIGASYFLKLKTLSFEELWMDCLKPLLKDYIQGMYDEDGIMKSFEKAYGIYSGNGLSDEANQNQR